MSQENSQNSETMMQAAVFEGPESLSLKQVPEPQPGPGQVLLRVSLAGVCATDAHIYHGRFKVPAPRILGHELAGVVEKVGPGVDEGWLGKTCGVKPAQFCGQCEPCKQGHEEFCLNFQCLGNTRDGGYAEKTLVEVDQLVHLPGVSLEALVWLEPLACVMNALEMAQAREGESVLVIGAGVMGRLLLKTMSALGITDTACVDPNPKKVVNALQNGARQGWVVPRAAPATHIDQLIHAWAPNGPQIVIDTTGKPLAFRRAIRWAGLAGRIILFGVPDPAAHMSLAPGDLFFKGLRVQACNGMSEASFRAGVELLASRRLDPTGGLAVHTDLPGAAEAFQRPGMFSQGKIFIHPAGEIQ